MPEIILNGPDGRLEARYHRSDIKDAPLALVLHPDPQRGGTMNNRITYMMYQAFVQRGFTTLRFNFRGVGKSQGEYDNGEGELSDAACALDWLQDMNPNAPFSWIGGFSFGSWIGMQLLMRRPEVKGFLAVSPPANMYDFSFLAPCPTGGLVIGGSDDKIVPQTHLDDFVEKITAQRGDAIDYRVIKGAGHFYQDDIDTVMSYIHDHLNGVNAGQEIEVQKLLKAA